MNAGTFCRDRGHHGPYINRDQFDRHPEPLWHGMANCVRCGSTVHVESEEKKRRDLAAADCAAVIGEWKEAA